MKVSLNWLKEYLPFEFELEEMLDRLTMTGLEVESVSTINPFYDNVVSAKITSVTPLPESRNLNLCDVYNGHETLQVVCGASNISIGDMVPLALPGAIISGKKIERTKIRNHESFGMLCSEKELQLGPDHSGIFILPDNLETGKQLHNVFSLKDTVIEIGITPNRGDCLSIRGIAREIAASYNQKCVNRPFKRLEQRAVPFSIILEQQDLCPYYGGAIWEQVEVKPSPFMFRYRLYLCGIRPINNVVDITNFILIDLGQPMHAFDLDKLKGNEIRVRYAREGESLLTLDGIERNLGVKDLVIADQKKPVALAGIMGGDDTSVDQNTRRVFLESAYFAPSQVRHTSSRLNISSDSSYRFERGTDPEAIRLSLALASEQAASLSNADILTTEVNLENVKLERKRLNLRTEKCNRILGIYLSAKEIAETLKKIEIKPLDKPEEFEIPGFRHDLEREIDLVEEVARIYGYSNIPEQKERIEINVKKHAESYEIKKKLSEALIRLGCTEAINYSFVSHRDLIEIEDFIIGNKQSGILNPLSPEQSVMRNSLFPGLMKNFIHSKNYQMKEIKLFEIGNVFLAPNKNKTSSIFAEENHVGYLIGGTHTVKHPEEKSIPIDYFDLKGITEELLTLLMIPFTFQPFTGNFFKNGFKVMSGTNMLGVAGWISPQVAKNFGSKECPFYAEFQISALLGQSQTNSVQYTQISRLPSVVQDISFMIDETVTHEDIIRVIEKEKIPFLENISIFDIYRGEHIPEGKKGVLYSLTYHNPKETLTVETVNRFQEQIKQKLSEKLKAEFR